jgi:hypothetical protein
MTLPMLFTLMFACVRVEHDFNETVSSQGIDVLASDIERGDVTYQVGADTEFDIVGTSWGRGGGEKKASAHEDENTFGVDIAAGLVDVWGRSDHRKGGVDVDVRGPSVVHLDLITLDGTVYMSDAVGTHVVTASRIEATALAGDADLYATNNGMDVELWPYDDGVIRLDSVGGDVILSLPYGADYDIQVWADGEYGLDVAELGFDNFYMAPDYFAGSRGTESIDVKVYVTGGSFSLLESFN